MSEKRFEYDVGDKGPLIYDNNGVDDYYFINDPKEIKEFIKLINNNEEYWQEKYNHLLNEYQKQLKKENEQFIFNVTEHPPSLNKNKLDLTDKHTQIKINGSDLFIIVTPPNNEPHTLKYIITGTVFEENYNNIKTRHYL